MLTLNLGCGPDIIKGAINCDYRAFKGVDRVIDLNERLPFSNESADKIIIKHCLEHLDYENFMTEAKRILKTGGLMEIVVTYWTNPHAAIGEHKTPGFSWVAFEHFSDPNHPFYCFEVLENTLFFGKKLGFFGWFFNRNPPIYDRFFSHIIPATELRVVLKKRGTHA